MLYTRPCTDLNYETEYLSRLLTNPRSCNFMTNLIHLFLKLGITLFVSLATILFLVKLQSRTGLNCILTYPEEKLPRLKPNRYTFYIISITLLFIFFLVLMLLTTWPKGDEWMLITCRESGLSNSFRGAGNQYYIWCSRIAEFIGIAFGLSRSMWENRILTPFFISVIPFISFALCAPRESKLSSRDGFLFIVAEDSLLLLIAPYFYASYWCNVTYVWTAAFSVLVLLLFRRCHSRGLLISFGAFSAAVIAGWSTECGAFSLGLLITLLTYEHIRKRTWSNIQTIIIVGFVAGCFMLYSSPAMHNRSGSAQTFLSTMTPDQIHEYVRNLSWEKVKALKGGAVIAVLKDVPYHLRIYFWPYLMELFWGIAGPALIACGAISCLSVGDFRKNRKILIHGGIGLTVSIVCATIYLAGAIPNQGSLYPAAVITLLTFCYLFTNIKLAPVIRGFIAAILCAASLIQYVPGIVDALRMIPLRTQRDIELDRQARLRREEIILPPIPELEHPQSEVTYTLTARWGITDDSKSWTNTNVANWVKVHYGYMPKSVIQQKSGK